MAAPTRTSFRTCPLCEATCGLEITTSNGDVTAVRADSEDVFSHGVICPKGVGLQALHDDPDRLRGPVRRLSLIHHLTLPTTERV
jgi:anaerobic selenocysteine-containing dehydrogenase